MSYLNRDASDDWSSMPGPGFLDPLMDPAENPWGPTAPVDAAAASEVFQHYTDEPAIGQGRPPVPMSREELAGFLE